MVIGEPESLLIVEFHGMEDQPLLAQVARLERLMGSTSGFRRLGFDQPFTSPRTAIGRLSLATIPPTEGDVLIPSGICLSPEMRPR